MSQKKISLKKHGEIAHTYLIKHKNRTIWEGTDLKNQLNRIKKEIPLHELAVSWKTEEEHTIG
ncbi:MAG: hypothetical protein GF307_04420 [candidate division Zixibacteria bacterium]|nr:hypothetical protein [candidate division Zixibacteria bacterium]